jgi:hypothetical protein
MYNIRSCITCRENYTADWLHKKSIETFFITVTLVIILTRKVLYLRQIKLTLKDQQVIQSFLFNYN